MLAENDFHRLADSTLARMQEALEEADAKGALDAELEQGALTIGLPGGRQYLISKHAASRQIWVSSPLSGGLHFSPAENGWRLPDGRALALLVAEELQQLAGVSVAFP